MYHNFKNAKMLLENILSKYGVSSELVQLYDIWEEVVGKNLSKKIQLCGVKNKTLLVKVETSAHHHYLNLYQKKWLNKINQILKKTENDGFKNIKVVKL